MRRFNRPPLVKTSRAEVRCGNTCSPNGVSRTRREGRRLMLAPIERVAALGLLYMTLVAEHYGENPEVALLDDLEWYPDRTSFFLKLGSQIGETDQGIVRILDIASRTDSSPAALARDLAPHDELRTEALLHAWPRDPRDELAAEEWAQPFLERWELVDAMMTGLEPLTWNRERADDVVRAALALAHDGLRERLERLEDAALGR